MSLRVYVCVSVSWLSEGLVLASGVHVVLLVWVVKVVGLVAVVAVADDRMLDAFSLQLLLLVNSLQLCHQLSDEGLGRRSRAKCEAKSVSNMTRCQYNYLLFDKYFPVTQVVSENQTMNPTIEYFLYQSLTCLTPLSSMVALKNKTPTSHTFPSLRPLRFSLCANFSISIN